MDKECFSLIPIEEWRGNRGEPVEEFIDERRVIFTYYKNGKIVISVACHNRPFNIQTEDDLIILYSFFGQARERFENHISDPRGRLVLLVPNWILKQCDLNKDVPITDDAQVSLPDIQLSTAFRVFKLYVKNLAGQAHYRYEESLYVNQPIRILESMLNPYEALEKKIDLLTDAVDSLISINKGRLAKNEFGVATPPRNFESNSTIQQLGTDETRSR